ncbi:MAG: alanine racemase [Candidatus Woykebacteria bacterium RBG_13_40_15]|uniref:Alanine racemase n=1 Tax=Candidatus Woykebacteria bacterium RBG_13_40_15 TaxID=1802593 RepID=A0A1G1W5Y2_9BACT|nr:MAG: alanine racemase [Candidatus Woykebacteria bacterium RBG_13_40_15]
MALERLAWCEISKSALKQNLAQIQNFVGGKTAIMAVVKANAYGHGAVEVSKTALDAGVKMLGVSSFVEAKQLREVGIKASIVILGFTPAENYMDIVNFDVTVTIRSLDVARALSTAARRENKTAKVWVKVDSGMHRLGLNPGEVLFFIKKLQDLPNLVVEGIFTHFADADNPNLDFAKKQLVSFQRVLAELEKEEIKIPVCSAANSAATFKLPGSHLDMVRIGIAMYGLKPVADFDCGLDLQPALTFKTEITQITEINKGESVGYGRGFFAKRPTMVATLAVGYGDGFRRGPKNWGEVLIRSQRVPLVGRVSMDQAAVDITDIRADIRRGEEVVLIGRGGDDQILAEEVADKLGTISYEVVSAISARVPRIYK